MTSAATTFSLSALLGMPAGTGCLIGLEQVRTLAALLLRNRPSDLQACCFVGGTLGVGQRPHDNVVMLTDAFGGAPFLVVAGEQGAVALLTWAEGNQYRARLICDPELVDRAALVLAQLSDHNYNLGSLVEAEVQQAFVARLAVSLVAELRLDAPAYRAMMPDEQLWPALAAALAPRSGPEALLAAPEVRQMLQGLAVQQVLLGQLDADQHQLTPLAATGGSMPQRLLVQHHGVVASVIRRGRPGSAASMAASGLDGLGVWAQGGALTAVPLLRDERAWGLLLAASPRPLSGPTLTKLAGLGALLALHLGPTTVSGTLAHSPAPRPGPTQSAPPRPVTPGPTAIERAAPRVVPRAASTITRDLGALLAQLGDAVLLVDGQGRVAAYTDALARLLGMSMDAHGQPLVASGGACLAPLLTEVLMDEPVEALEVELPTGGKATATVVEFAQGLWAFVLRQAAVASSPDSPVTFQAPAAPVQPNIVTDGERNESFLSNFSNIIRIPLRELRELITRVPAAGELNEQQSRLIGQVVKLNSELTMLVNDLLALGQIRLESSERRAPLRLDLLIDAAVGTQYAEFGRRGQHVITDLPPGLPRVSGSEEGLGRALAAMIDNAIKYSPTGAQITVKAYQEDDEVVVSIEDTGPGLLPEELEQVFDPFYRAESTVPLGISGRGLGLTITKAVIEQHNGRIWATSTPGAGTMFAFSLPCGEAAAPSPNPGASASYR